MFRTGHVPAHKGKSITTDPVKTSTDVQKIKDVLALDPRGLALWTLATNTMLRSGDLVQLRWDELHDQPDGSITLKLLEGKTDKRRVISIPPQAANVIRVWRDLCFSEFVFSGQRGQLTTAAWGRMVKHWAQLAGLQGRFCGHSTRKTGVRIRYDEHNVKLATLMHMLNHTSEATTLVYMGRMTEEVNKAYAISV
jgi:integrase